MTADKLGRRQAAAFLRCGILANGFSPVHCGDCGKDAKDDVVAFSCKGRGFMQRATVQLQHGGRIRIDVQAKDGQFVPGKVRLVDAGGRQSSPSLHAPGRGNGPGGELWAPGPLSTAMSALPPGRYEVVVDVGAHGVHRRFVDVRRCAVADVTFTLP